MSAYRALIVDDSRSARQVLSRMLESFGLEVDTVETAELALTYLQGARPDVIFMDHLMPGMDGFAAVRVIKANPDTATIPVLMYTSQEGEMYLSQARALGAMGVLPKTLKHADVAEALQHLNLHTPVVAAKPERSAAREAAPVEVIAAAVVEPEVQVADAVPALGLASGPILGNGVSLPQLAHRIASEVQAELQRTSLAVKSGNAWRVAALLASALALVLLGVVIYQQQQMQRQLAQLQTPAVITAPAPLEPALPVVAASSAASVYTPAPAPTMESKPVAYGEVPLAGERLDYLRALVEQLHDKQAKALIRVELFLGNFCLSGSVVGGYSPAMEDLLASRCDVIGNPFGDALTPQQRQSVGFANLLASIRGTDIKVQLADGGHRPVLAYPMPSATLTAGMWNEVAARNQRVEFTVLSLPE